MLTTRLHQRDQDDDDSQHHFGHEALIAVANTEIAEAAAANRTNHGRIAEQADESGRHSRPPARVMEDGYIRRVPCHFRFLSRACAISRWCCKCGKVFPAQSFSFGLSPPLA